MKIRKSTGILLLFLAIPFISMAQDWHVGAFLGISNYSGDLVEQKVDLKYTRPALGILVRKDFNRYFSLRGAITYGVAAGADSTNANTALVARNLNFRSRIIEFALIGELNFLDIDEKGFTPYVFAGIAGFGFDPQAKDQSGNWVRLRRLGTEGQGLPQYPDRLPYDMFTVSVPFGVGFKAILSDRWTLGFELGLRPTITDYLDDVSKTYVDQNTLLAYRGQASVDMAYRGDEVSKLTPGTYPVDGSKRGSDKYKDWYGFTGFTITYRLGNGGNPWGRVNATRCPRF